MSAFDRVSQAQTEAGEMSKLSPSVSKTFPKQFPSLLDLVRWQTVDLTNFLAFYQSLIWSTHLLPGLMCDLGNIPITC